MMHLPLNMKNPRYTDLLVNLGDYIMYHVRVDRVDMKLPHLERITVFHQKFGEAPPALRVRESRRIEKQS